MTFNREWTRYQVERAIDTAPLYVDVYREQKTPDGYGGFVKAEPCIVNHQIKILLDNASMYYSPKLLLRYSGGGRQYGEDMRFFVLWEEWIDIQVGDWIEALGRTYVINNVTNVLGLNFLYECKLSLKDVDYEPE